MLRERENTLVCAIAHVRKSENHVVGSNADMERDSGEVLLRRVCCVLYFQMCLITYLPPVSLSTNGRMKENICLFVQSLFSLVTIKHIFYYIEYTKRFYYNISILYFHNIQTFPSPLSLLCLLLRRLLFHLLQPSFSLAPTGFPESASGSSSLLHRPDSYSKQYFLLVSYLGGSVLMP